MTFRALRLALLACLGAATACHDGDAAANRGSFATVVEVTSDPGVPVAGALVAVVEEGSGTTGTEPRTDADGRVSLQLAGRQGDAVRVRVACPEGFVSPREPLVVKLRAFVPGQPTPVYAASCAPHHRSVVVAVRAPGAAFVPVLRLGQPIAVTNAEGVAHALLEGTPGETLTLTLDTEEAVVELHPSRPSVSRQVPERNDYLLFDFKVTVVPPKRAVVRRARPTRI